MLRRCIGRSDRSARGDRPTLQAIRPKHARIRHQIARPGAIPLGAGCEGDEGRDLREGDRGRPGVREDSGTGRVAGRIDGCPASSWSRADRRRDPDRCRYRLAEGVRRIPSVPRRRRAHFANHARLAFFWNSRNPTHRDKPMIPYRRPSATGRQGRRAVGCERERGLNDGAIRRAITIDIRGGRAPLLDRALPMRGPATALGRAGGRGATRGGTGAGPADTCGVAAYPATAASRCIAAYPAAAAHRGVATYPAAADARGITGYPAAADARAGAAAASPIARVAQAAPAAGAPLPGREAA